MRFLAEKYRGEGFPNHHVWNFSFPEHDVTASELRAAGFIKMLGLGGSRWVLTDAGQRWCMRNRTDLGLSVSARVLFRKITTEYEEAGSPGPTMMAWSADSEDEARAFRELQRFTLVEEHTAMRWRLTEIGLDLIGRI